MADAVFVCGNASVITAILPE